jgi:hypothetical protein
MDRRGDAGSMPGGEGAWGFNRDLGNPFLFPPLLFESFIGRGLVNYGLAQANKCGCEGVRCLVDPQLLQLLKTVPFLSTKEMKIGSVMNGDSGHTLLSSRSCSSCSNRCASSQLFFLIASQPSEGGNDGLKLS